MIIWLQWILHFTREVRVKHLVCSLGHVRALFLVLVEATEIEKKRAMEEDESSSR